MLGTVNTRRTSTRKIEQPQFLPWSLSWAKSASWVQSQKRHQHRSRNQFSCISQLCRFFYITNPAILQAALRKHGKLLPCALLLATSKSEDKSQWSKHFRWYVEEIKFIPETKSWKENRSSCLRYSNNRLYVSVYIYIYKYININNINIHVYIYTHITILLHSFQWFGMSSYCQQHKALFSCRFGSTRPLKVSSCQEFRLCGALQIAMPR